MTADADLQGLLDRIEAAARPLTAEGHVAGYIPALARVPRERFALAVVMADGREAAAGDADTPFSIQSVSKVFSLACALDLVGEALWRRVGREPSGMSFNSLILLEQERGVPRNPLINAGAIVVADVLRAADPSWPTALVRRLRELSGSAAVDVQAEVLASETEHGDLNRAIAWFLKSKGNLRGAPDAVLEAYFAACSIAMSARCLARAGRVLIGADPSNPMCREPERVRRILAIMRTCGLYDAAGDFAYRVGLPAKSGVGGGVLAIAPGRYAACAWSPALDEKGNSVAGVRALELLAQALDR